MVQRTASGGTACCPLCRAPFSATSPLSVNHELQELLTMAAAVGSLEAQDGWQAVGLQARPCKEDNDEQASTSTCDSMPNALEELDLFAPVPTAPPIPSESSSGATSPRLSSDSRRSSTEIIPAPGFSIPPRRFDVAVFLASGGSAADALEVDPPVWLPDSAADACMSPGCGKAFSLVTPRHHCRLCGHVVCSGCSKDRMMLPPKFCQPEPKRVCRSCAPVLAPLQAMLAGTLARAAHAPIYDAPDAASWRSLLNPPLSSSLETDIFSATNILQEFAGLGLGTVQHPAERDIPRRVLSSCAGIAVLSIVRVGAGWSGAGLGTGVVVARRSNGWSPPCGISVASLGVGWQLGAELVNVVIVLRDFEAVRTFTGKSLGLGTAVSVAAGPVGREATASWRVGTAGRGACLSYSLTRGAFMGMALEGLLVRTKDAANKKFYGRQYLPARSLLLADWVPQPPAAAALYRVLDVLVESVGLEEGQTRNRARR